ncbi:hypothetical protein H4R99_007119 [Coemansia sp. RSA 1722]|nr:hypothetical protein LPJ57_006587 [Coemansia sp. RSA 486]KAJ2225547.1 hypothetical protein IWW45_007824 [Coemansia sp. RSA 485]KAJ2590389.1 hypothetical protein H4R99_007119 [Coemansia sp. RSA 1722]
MSSSSLPKPKSELKRPAGQAFEDNDGSDEDLDALRWIERSRQRIKEQNEQKQKMKSVKKHKASLANKYSAEDLAGAKVAHSLADFATMQAGAEEHVLTLQDKTIDEMEDGAIELQSIALAENERARKNAETRRLKLGQMGIETVDRGGSYGDADNGEDCAKKSFFTIQSGGTIEGAREDEDSLTSGANEGHSRIKVSFDSELGGGSGAAVPVSDFYTEAEAAALFKKPRKSKKSKKSFKKATSNDFAEIVDADKVNSLLAKQSKFDDSQFLNDDDDDDLQQAISRVRRSATARAGARQMGKKGEAEARDIARQIREEAQAQMDVDPAASDAGSELVLSSTIEFVQALRSAATDPDAVEDKQASEAKGDADDEAEALIVKGARVRQDAAAPGSKRGLMAATADAKPSSTDAAPVNVPTSLPAALDQPEQTFGTGLGATLSFLRQRNMIDKMTEEQRRFEQQQRNRETWIAEQRRKEAELQRERQRIRQMGRRPETPKVPVSPLAKGRRGKADVLTQKELDEIKAKEQEMLDRKWAREYEERMKDYKPNVKIEYVDESGRQLSTKEAYKQLSHAFHGHYSGKNKIDKVNRQRERERKQMELNSSASAHQQAAVLENAHRKMGAAGVDLTQIVKQGSKK